MRPRGESKGKRWNTQDSRGATGATEQDATITRQKSRVLTAAVQEESPKQAPVDYAALREQSKAEKKKRQRIDFLEKQIAKDESRMKAIEAVLSAPGEGDDIIELTREYLELKRDCDAWTSEWVELND